MGQRLSGSCPGCSVVPLLAPADLPPLLKVQTHCLELFNCAAVYFAVQKAPFVLVQVFILPLLC